MRGVTTRARSSATATRLATIDGEPGFGRAYGLPAEEAVGHASTMARTRLLLVHPDPHAWAMLASMLRPSGHELIEATSDRVWESTKR